MKKPTIIIYTDGSSRGNPGPGGWGAIIAWGDDKSKVESVKHAPLETARARSVSPSLMGSKVIELGGGEKHTTNNRMELAAAIAALGVARDLARLPPPKVTQAGHKETPSISLVSPHGTLVNLRSSFGGQDNATTIDMRVDSRYVINGITKWVYAWQKNGWMNSKKEEVLNRDLWEELAGVVSDIQLSGTTIAWNYTPGHAGIPGNDRADEIATTFADGKPTKLFDGARSLYSVDLGIHTGDAKKIAAKKSKPKSSAKAYSYVSLVAEKFMKHATWAECEKRVKGVTGAKFKKAFSADDERSIEKEWRG
ncbi:MAG: Ribonuclease H [Parcubacteria group bacterium GW2011_GWA1_47_8]|nr:MAG: Ribonuclease H [Parcubacteria group bacterium GW2011_GWA1_47_8]KKW07640.1 MAG: Ribonuclease H [Parcubacteria group bacterium GW2011_GWA2_49_16]